MASKGIIIVTGAGQIIRCENRDEAVRILREHRSDPYCSVWGAYEQEPAICQEAGYQGASEAECIASLEGIRKHGIA
jgi:hypothetical protein